MEFRITGWSANPDVHWIVSCICLAIYSIAIFIVLQCVFVYIPFSYPQYAASLFAGNDFCRSMFAFGAVLFGRPMYIKLGVGKGTTLLGGLSILGIVSNCFLVVECGGLEFQRANEYGQIGMWVLYFHGARLRARSTFAVG